MVERSTSRMRPWRGIVTDLIVFVSFAAICGAMLMTVGDILVRLAAQLVGAVAGVRPRWGLFGLVDLTQLAMMTAGPLAIAAAFFRNAHIRIDLILNRSSRPMRVLALRAAALLGIGLTGLCLWAAWSEMRAQLDFTTTSATLGIAYTWYWLPLIAGLALSVLAEVVILIWPIDGGEANV